MALPLTPIHHRLRTRTGQIIAAGRFANRRRQAFRPSLLQNLVGAAAVGGAALLGYGATRAVGAQGYTPRKMSVRKRGPRYDPNYRSKRHRSMIYKTPRGRYGAGRKTLTIPKPELHFFDHAYLQNGITATGEIVSLITASAAGITVGTGAQNRLGRKIFVKNITIRLKLIQNNVTASGSPAMVRVAMIQDRQANGANPSYSDIFKTGVIPDELCYNELFYSNRFKTWMNKFCVMEWHGGEGNGTTFLLLGAQKFIQKTFEINQVVQYDNSVGTTGTIDEIMSNNFVMAFAASDSNVQYELGIRVRFTNGGA